MNKSKRRKILRLLRKAHYHIVKLEALISFRIGDIMLMESGVALAYDVTRKLLQDTERALDDINALKNLMLEVRKILVASN